jgi:hypothetical protein
MASHHSERSICACAYSACAYSFTCGVCDLVHACVHLFDTSISHPNTGCALRSVFEPSPQCWWKGWLSRPPQIRPIRTTSTFTRTRSYPSERWWPVTRFLKHAFESSPPQCLVDHIETGFWTSLLTPFHFRDFHFLAIAKCRAPHLNTPTHSHAHLRTPMQHPSLVSILPCEVDT